jgi:hypothetical protein
LSIFENISVCELFDRRSGKFPIPIYINVGNDMRYFGIISQELPVLNKNKLLVPLATEINKNQVAILVADVSV